MMDTGRRYLPRAMHGIVIVIVASLTVAACGGEEASAFTRDGIVSVMADEGFSGETDQLDDGRPRWLGRGPDGAILEIIGPADAPEAVTFTVVASEASGELMGEVLARWAPGSTDFFRSVLADAGSGGDQDQERRIRERTVRVQTLATSDGGLVVTTISE